MGIFFFNDKKLGFDLSLLSAGIRISDDNELLKKYDKNKNSIFDADELSEFVKDVEKSLDANGDKQITQGEADNWIKSKIGEVSAQNRNIVKESFEYLYNEQAKANAIEILNLDITNGINTARAAHGGDITQAWNAIKESIGSDLAESKVSKQLFNKYLGTMLLQAVLDGNTTINEINEVLANMEQLLPGAGAEAEILHKEFAQFRSFITSYLEKATGNNPNRQINFEAMFKQVTGVDFNSVKINEYKKKAVQAQFAASVNNRIAPLQYDLAQKFEKVYWDEESGEKLPPMEFGNEDKGPVFNLRELRNSITNALDSYFGGDSEAIKQYLQTKMNVSYITDLDRYKTLQLAKVLYQDLTSKKDEILKEIIGNKSLEEFSKELKESYTRAFGDSGTDLANDFAESQQTGMAAAKIGTGVASLAVVLLSHGTLIPILLGTATSIGGIAAVSLVEGRTKEGGMTSEDWQNLKQELKVSGLFAVAGVGIGMTSAKIGATLLSKCPQFMGKIASLVTAKGVEYASDFAMTMLTDMVITGEIHLAGDSIAELLNIIMGIAAGKKAYNTRQKAKKTEKADTQSPSKPQAPEQNPKSILADKSHKINVEEMDIISRDVEKIFNSDKTTAEKLNEIHSMNEELSKMPQTPEVMALREYLDSTEASLKNLKDVEDVLREAGYTESGNLKDDMNTIDEEIGNLIRDKGRERTYTTNDGDVRMKYDEETGLFVIEKSRPSKELEGGVKDTDLTEVAHEARHLAGSGDNVANPIFDSAAADRICSELSLTDTDKFILENLREGDTHIIDGPDNTEIIITRGSKDFDVQVRIKENEVCAKGVEALRRIKTDPYEVTQGQMDRETPYNINPDRLPVLELGNGEYIDLNYPEYARLIYSLKEGTGITIGREGTIKTDPNNNYVSRIHVEIYKENCQLKIVDHSSNGTRVVSAAENAYVAEAATGTMVQNLTYEVSLKNLPVLEFPGGVKLELSQYKSRIANMREGQTLVIGKEGDIPVSGNDYISRQHVIIYKSNGVLKIKNIHQNQVNIKSNGFLDRVKNKINELIDGFSSSSAHSSVTFTEQEKVLFNSFKNYPEIRALTSRPAELKKVLERINSIVADRSVVSEEIAEALFKGHARLNGSSPENVACLVEKNVLNDIVKMAKGEDYIMHFSRGTSEQKILQQLPVGEVANVGGQLYMNSGSSLEAINLSESRFRQLFPPVKRFSTHQGAVGDCYLVSTLERMYASPLGRVKLYRRIGEDANGIYTLTAENNYEKTYFKRFDSQNKHIQEEGGLAIIEQGYCKNSARGAREFNPRETIIMDVNAGGLSNWAIGGLIGRQPTRTKDPAAMRRYIMQNANNPNCVINAGTRSGGYHDDTHFHNRQYNIYTNHEYSIKGYNAQNDCILLCNPHQSGVVMEVPLSEFLKYCDDFTIIDINC